MSAAERLVTLLRERGLTLAVAESLTGGDVCSAIVSVPGASQVLRGGIVAYATEMKRSLLGVDPALLAQVGAVHPDVAAHMAQGVRAAMAVAGKSADIGISTTGVAGPDPQDGMPVGTVHISVASEAGASIRSFLFDGDRAQVRHDATLAALDEALAYLDARE